MGQTQSNPSKPGRPRDAAGSSETKTTFEDIKQKAADDLGNLKGRAEDQMRQVASKAKEVASDQKNVAARYAESLGAALEKVATEMRQSDGTEISRYAGELGANLQSFAKDIEDRKLGDIAAMAEDFGRRQPVAFLGAAALAGFVASRFLTATSQRNVQRQGDTSGDFNGRG